MQIYDSSRYLHAKNQPKFLTNKMLTELNHELNWVTIFRLTT